MVALSKSDRSYWRAPRALSSVGNHAAKGPESMKLSRHDIVLIRCGLLRRLDNLKGRPECEESYIRSKELLNALFPLARDGNGAILTPKED